MDLIKKYKIKHLTKKQKQKCIKISELIKGLTNEGVHACVASTPQNKIIFYRADKWLDSMEEIQDLHNDKRDFVFDLGNDTLIDAVGY